jgi:predicted acyl esterase
VLPIVLTNEIYGSLVRENVPDTITCDDDELMFRAQLLEMNVWVTGHIRIEFLVSDSTGDGNLTENATILSEESTKFLDAHALIPI